MYLTQSGAYKICIRTIHITKRIEEGSLAITFGSRFFIQQEQALREDEKKREARRMEEMKKKEEEEEALRLKKASLSVY